MTPEWTRRRQLLLMASAALAARAGAAPTDAQEQALRAGLAAGGVLMFRHALAPGTFDPPGFRLDDCATQRNLNEEGRRQARRIGAWFAERGWRPSQVRSSPWCRCLETARLAFGDQVQAWAALGSPRAGQDEANALALAQLRARLAAVVKQRAGFEAWVTHMFVFSALLGEGAGSGDAALLGMDEAGAPRVIVRLTGLGA
jgi:hypothetical protein